MQQRQRVEQLARVSLFEGCSKRDLARLAAKARVETVDAGHTLFTEGAPSTDLYVILAGTVLVKRNGRRIARLGPGDVIGELGVILDTGRSATAVAETPTEWLALDRASFRAAIDDVPGLGWKVLTAVAARLDESNNRPS